MAVPNGSFGIGEIAATFEPPPAREALTVDGMPRRYQPRNCLLFSACTAMTGFGFSLYGVILTPYFNWLGLSNFTVAMLGSAASLSLIGTFLTPLISRRFVRKKWLTFSITVLFLWFVASIGIAILVATRVGPGTWLARVTIISYLFWPFLCGWGGVPGQEYLANCISKERIGAFIGAQSIIAPVFGLLGSLAMTLVSAHTGVPMTYALAFLAAYAVAQLSSILALFAHETPAPPPPAEPFWRPAQHAVLHDFVFSRLLLTGFILSVLIGFPITFMPFLAIREWGMPDWVAAGFATVLTGSRLVGASLGSWIGQKVGYVKSVAVCLAFFPLSMLPLVWPRIGGTTSYDAYRFFVSAALYGIASTGVAVAVQSLMYLLAPSARRSGYFSAFLIMQTIATTVAVSLSGVVFRPGTYQIAFAVVMMVGVAILLLSGRLFKALREGEVNSTKPLENAAVDA